MNLSRYFRLLVAGLCLGALSTNALASFAYVANGGSNSISVYTIDQTTGALTAGTAVAAGTSPQSVTTTAGASALHQIIGLINFTPSNDLWVTL